jgi:potassium inwardly-rectifying channel subfamily J
MAIAWIHGDLKFDPVTGARVNAVPCIMGATSFSGFFLLSVESQVSTGYGTWYPSEECSDAITALIVQLIVGLVIDAAIVGIVYQKLTRPPKYSYSEFSKHAVVCQRDEKFCLLFRVADFRQTRSIDSKIRAYLFEEGRTKEGESIGKRQKRLKIEASGRVFMIWPQTVCHVIDETSPLYGYGPMDFEDGRFEIIVGLKGESSYSGHTTQARASYLPHEVLWGYRFLNIVTYDNEVESFVADVEMMDETERVNMPQCSAKTFDMRKKLRSLKHKNCEI